METLATLDWLVIALYFVSLLGTVYLYLSLWA